MSKADQYLLLFGAGICIAAVPLLLEINVRKKKRNYTRIALYCGIIILLLVMALPGDDDFA